MSELERERRVWSRRRRENVPGGRRHQHKVLVTPEEEAALLLRADKLGVTVARLLVESALAGGAEAVAAERAEMEDRRALWAELNRLQRAVGAIGVNINQLAKVSNATGELDEQLRHSLAHLRRVLVRGEEFFEQWGVRS